MQTILLNALILIIKQLIDANIFKAIELLVIDAMNFDISGEEKRAKVLEQLHNISGSIAPILASTASWVINLALEAIVAKLKNSN